MTDAIDLTDDTLARQCLEARDRIRAMFAQARIEASRWTPKPYPTKETR